MDKLTPNILSRMQSGHWLIYLLQPIGFSSLFWTSKNSKTHFTADFKLPQNVCAHKSLYCTP